MVINQALTVLI